MIDKFMLHPLPNTLAVFVLLALIVSWLMSILLAFREEPVLIGKNSFTATALVFSLLSLPAIYDVLQTQGTPFVFAAIAGLAMTINIAVLLMGLIERTAHALVKDWTKWAIPVLALGGLAVAGYFVLLEVTGGQVVCGPSKGCDAVQNSRFALLFGIIPMGMLGLAGYLAILAGWIIWQYGPASLQKPGSLSVWGFSIFGVLFSTYLTFLEPFVIGATCMWCITSAVFMINLLLVSTPTAQQALALQPEDDDEPVPERA